MLFNSIDFLIFFPLISALYFAVPHKFRWPMLLAASSLFYMAFIPAYIFVLAYLIAVDFTAGILIERARTEHKRRYLLMSIVSTLGVLFIFKYFDFFSASVADVAAFFDWNYSHGALELILPLGLSFHTFQSLSYVIEVYRGKVPAEKNPGIYALYVMFYPQLVAGPIERPYHMLPQFHTEHRFEYQRVVNGLKLMTWGMFKKVVIADRLALIVDPIFGAPSEYGPITLGIAMIAFAIQIYCDFSGYSDIAIGSAQVMGYRLMTNFDRPYLARSVGEFWHRWHISLSTWFRDYVYIPLGGSRVPAMRHALNLMLTFLLSAVWHGANWTFVIWGLLHGSYMLVSVGTAELRERLWSMLRNDRSKRIRSALARTTTFFLVTIAWVFFRADTVTEAFSILGRTFTGSMRYLTMFATGHGQEAVAAISGEAAKFPVDAVSFLVTLMAVAVMAYLYRTHQEGRMDAMLVSRPTWSRWFAYYVLVLGMLFFGSFGENQFIYFQF